VELKCDARSATTPAGFARTMPIVLATVAITAVEKAPAAMLRLLRKLLWRLKELMKMTVAISAGTLLS
jgi:hypothetical protein